MRKFVISLVLMFAVFTAITALPRSDEPTVEVNTALVHP